MTTISVIVLTLSAWLCAVTPDGALAVVPTAEEDLDDGGGVLLVGRRETDVSVVRRLHLEAQGALGAGRTRLVEGVVHGVTGLHF